MSGYLGITSISGIYVGSTPINNVYRGSTAIFTSAPTYSGVSPSSASSGTTITITGTGFSAGSVSVTIGGYAANNVVVAGDTSLTCKMAGAVLRGAQSITITTAIGSVTASNAITVTRPTISNFSPTSGAAGADLTINGFDFAAPMTVNFTKTGQEPISATNITVVSSSQIVCKVPTLTTGDYRLSIAAQDGSGSTSGTNFSYAGNPTYSSIAPASGLAGSTVTITGTNFVAGSTSVTIGGLSAGSVSVSSPTSLTCTVPSGLTGGTAYNVVITTSSGSVTGTGVFTFTIPSPTISSLSPTSGKVGTSVTIYGTNFVTGGTSVTIGGVSATPVSVTNSTTLTCVVPSFSSSNYKDVVITTANGSVTSSNAFFYYAVPTLTGYSVGGVTSSQINPGVTVTVSGTNFVGSGGTTVTVGGAAATVTSTTASTLKFTVPTIATDGTKAIAITTVGGTATLNAIYYTARTPTTTTYTTGPWSYTIPDWCNKIDVVLIGGGKGGAGGSGTAPAGVDGQGGSAGSWATAVWYRGSDFPWSATTITGTVGTGGTGGQGIGTGAGGAGGNGTNSTATCGSASLTGAGATTTTGTSGAGTLSNGGAPGNVTVSGVTYTGGTGGVAQLPGPSGSGTAPGAGGAGGWRWLLGSYNGGAGAAGQVWLRAYQ